MNNWVFISNFQTDSTWILNWVMFVVVESWKLNESAHRQILNFLSDLKIVFFCFSKLLSLQHLIHLIVRKFTGNLITIWTFKMMFKIYKECIFKKDDPRNCMLAWLVSTYRQPTAEPHNTFNFQQTMWIISFQWRWCGSNQTGRQ